MIRHVLLATALLAVTLPAAAQEWVEGRHYQQVPNPQDARDDGKIEVAEFFWYGCPSCYSFEPHLNEWVASKAADVEFTRYAASLAQPWRVHARAYYTAESLGIVEQVHGALFRAIHEDRNPLNTPEAIGRVFIDAAGVDAEAFQRAYDSFGVETRLRRGDQLARRYQLQGVPTIVVNGRWVTGPQAAQGYERLISLVDHLVELERGAPAPQSNAESAAAPAVEQPTAQPVAAVDADDEPDAGTAASMWWVWLLALVAIAAFVIVGVRRNKP
ncbi:MAG: thiol:disulfide interchange protein DsbA/DsbL [Gammaproteobacteria bacterium]